jgi:AcrR family transcriptional regulator
MVIYGMLPDMSAQEAPATRSDRRRLQTRADLLEAARRLFAERGVGEVTIQEITEAADVAKGSFYNHFESREDLQRAAAEVALEELGAANDRDVSERERDPARVIASSLLSTLRTCLADPALGGFLLKNADLVATGDAILMRGKRDLLRGRRSGRFAIEDVDMLLTAVAGAGQSVLRARLRGELSRASELRFIALVLRMLGLETAEAQAIATEAAATVAGGRT